MRIVNQSIELLTKVSPGGIQELKHIENIGRTCYKSNDKIAEDGSSAIKFVKGLIKREHFAMIEHGSLSVLCTTDRGVSHELTRHRIMSFAQESTRYCNYSLDKFDNEITVIRPWYFNEESSIYQTWHHAMELAEITYFNLLKNGALPEQARAVLPNSLKTEIIMTANYREWRHFLELRAEEYSGPVHPQMHELAVMILRKFKRTIPVIFDDIAEGNINNLPICMR